MEILVPQPIAFIGVLALGAIIGSFLNVIIHRLPREESVVFPNSRCASCGAAIRPYDNVPVLSYILLGGRCRSCKTSFSPRYPAVEILTAIAYALFLANDGLTLFLLFDLVFVSAIIALTFIDAEHGILPNAITYPGLIFALAVRMLIPNLYGLSFLAHAGFTGWPPWALSLIGSILGAAFGGGFLWLVGWLWESVRGVEAMGLGDVKMMLMVGAYLGLPLTILTIFLGVVTASIAGVAQISFQAWNETRRWKGRLNTGARIALFNRRTRRGMQSTLPFGVFLGIGATISLLSGPSIINWYLRHLLFV